MAHDNETMISRQNQTHGPDTFGRLSFTLAPTLPEVRNTLGKLRRALVALGTPDTGLDIAELVLAEILTNIVKHAYAGREADEISIEATARGPSVDFKICDHGHPMPDGQLPAARHIEAVTTIEDLPEGGFGWLIIRHHAQDLIYHRSGDRNQLSFRLGLGRLN